MSKGAYSRNHGGTSMGGSIMEIGRFEDLGQDQDHGLAPEDFYSWPVEFPQVGQNKERVFFCETIFSLRGTVAKIEIFSGVPDEIARKGLPVKRGLPES
ncbi:MAG: hypothetical protein VST70_07635 [Nitrospirota bacterium]|nr:hypothetical protein [Nitrospirota bacterium]